MALPKLQDIFLHAGNFYAKYPILTIVFTLAMFLLTIPGIMHLKITNDPIELWVDKSSKKYKQKLEKTNTFGDDFRIENLIFKLRKPVNEKSSEEILNDDKVTNLIQKKYLQEIYYFQSVVIKQTVDFKGKSYGIKDLCWRAFVNGECIIQSPMNYWQNYIERLNKDDDIEGTVSCFKSVDPYNSIACMDENKIPVVSQAVFGGMWYEPLDNNVKCSQKEYNNINRSNEVLKNDQQNNSILSREVLKKMTSGAKSVDDENNKKTSSGLDPCGLFKTRAETLSLSILLESNPILTEVYEMFEKEAIESLIKEFNSNTDTAFLKKWFPDIKVEPLKLHITYMLQRSVNDELEKETSQNYMIVVVSYLLMFIYVSFSLSKHWNLVGSSVLLSLCGLIYICISVFLTYSLCGLFGITANLISLEVIPFLILAIGVDNMFLIYNSVLNTPTEEISVKIPVGLRSVGLSILLSTFTQIATFIVGLYMDIPALRSFCMIAAIALLCNFFFQVTAFPALVTLDLQRKRAGRFDLFPCIRSKKYSDQDLKKFIMNDQSTNWSFKLFNKCWTPCVFSIPCKVVTLVVCLGLVVTCVPALIYLPLGLDQQNTTLKDGNLYQYFGDIKNYLEIGPQGYIIFKNADWTDIDTYTKIDKMIDFLSQKEGLIASSFRVWYQGMFSLQDSEYTNPEMLSVCFKGLDPNDYIGDIPKLASFYLTLGLDHPCCNAFSICGGQFYEDVVFNKNKDIMTTRIAFFHQKLRTQDDFISSMNDIQDLVDYFLENEMGPDDLVSLEIQTEQDSEPLVNVTEPTNLADEPKLFDAYPYSLYYIFFEQYSYVKGITVQNYILALMFLFCFVSCLYSAFTSLILVFIVLLISSNLWSLMWIQNFIFVGLPIEFNAVLVVNLIIAIGFSVEFCIHLIVRFRKAKGDKSTRAKKALNEIGSLIFQGIFLTKLIGLSVLYFSPIPLFKLYYFRVYITMILLCGFYGMVVSPVVLEAFTFQQVVNRRSFTEYFNLNSNKKVRDDMDPKKPETFNQNNLKSPPPEENEHDNQENPLTEPLNL